MTSKLEVQVEYDCLKTLLKHLKTTVKDTNLTRVKNPVKKSSAEVKSIAHGDPRSGSSGLTALRAFRVLRVLKTMSIVPGLRSIVQALLHSIQALKDAVVLTLF